MRDTVKHSSNPRGHVLCRRGRLKADGIVRMSTGESSGVAASKQAKNELIDSNDTGMQAIRTAVLADCGRPYCGGNSPLHASHRMGTLHKLKQDHDYLARRDIKKYCIWPRPTATLLLSTILPCRQYSSSGPATA